MPNDIIQTCRDLTKRTDLSVEVIRCLSDSYAKMTEMEKEIKSLRIQRDQVREDYCHIVAEDRRETWPSSHSNCEAEDIAKEMGWDDLNFSFAS